MKKGMKSLVTITMIVLVGFLVKAFVAKNYEFLGYWVVLVALFFFVVKLDEKFNFPLFSIWLFAIWAMLHMAGGLIKIGTTRLYDLILIPILEDPYFILKYDQLIHAYCYVAISILVYFILKKYVINKKALFTISVVVAFGIGALNEIIEFGMVIFADAAAAVGGYYNNALDLVFNLIGAVIGSLFAGKLIIKR
jgi:putative membrane protein